MADVAAAVTQGDLTRQITVEASGEVAELKDSVNQMIANLRDTTQQNAEQDWLKTNLARISGLMQGQRDLQTVSRMIMSRAHAAGRRPARRVLHGRRRRRRRRPTLRLIASYGYKKRKNLSNEFTLRRGPGRPGGARDEERSSSPTRRADYVKITSGLGEALPVNLIVLPILFEEQVLAVIELASLQPVRRGQPDVPRPAVGDDRRRPVDDHRQHPHRGAARGVSSRSPQELQSPVRGAAGPAGRAQALQHRARGAGEVAAGLRGAAADPAGGAAPDQRGAAGEGGAARPAEPRHRGQERRDRARARWRSRSAPSSSRCRSKYKSEFLANMCHELRTPLNSLLILSKLLADNPARQPRPSSRSSSRGRSTARAPTCSTLISDILDLSKVEAGKMDVAPGAARRSARCSTALERSFRPVAEREGARVRRRGRRRRARRTIVTDEQRLRRSCATCSPTR